MRTAARLTTIFAMTLGMRYAFAQQPGASDAALLRATEPERNFFLKQLGGCPACKTMTVVVSDKKPDAALLDAFRSVADRLGKDHAGSVATRYELWRNWKVFADHGCSTMEQIADSFVLYVDRTESFCAVFPYKDPKHLIAVVSIVEQHLRDPGKIRNERWRYLTTASIDDYFVKNQAIEPFRGVTTALVDYVAGLLIRK